VRENWMYLTLGEREHPKVAQTIVVGASCSLELPKANKIFALRAPYVKALQICQNGMLPGENCYIFVSRACCVSVEAIPEIVSKP